MPSKTCYFLLYECVLIAQYIVQLLVVSVSFEYIAISRMCFNQYPYGVAQGLGLGSPCASLLHVIILYLTYSSQLNFDLDT